jgi:transposase
MQRTPGNSKEERETYWVGIIQEARKYSAGIAAYCRDKGVQQNNYYYWFHRLRVLHPEWNEERDNPVLRAVPSTMEVDDRPIRRRFTAAYKRKILKEVAASAKGQVASLLRREGLYASQIRKWTEEAERSGTLEPRKRGPKSNPLAAENKKLVRENERLLKQLKQAQAVNELQKKIAH